MLFSGDMKKGGDEHLRVFLREYMYWRIQRIHLGGGGGNMWPKATNELNELWGGFSYIYLNI